MSGVMYILSTGCQWRALPKELPPRSTVFSYCDLWLSTAHWIAFTKCCMNDAASRRAPTSNPPPASSTSQSVKGVEKGAHIDPHGFDAGKLIKGKKRHILVDTQGLLLAALVHRADLQDRDSGTCCSPRSQYGCDATGVTMRRGTRGA
jgi:putative transposase